MKKVLKIILFILLLFLLISSGYFIYTLLLLNNIENILRLFVGIFNIGMLLMLGYFIIHKMRHLKRKKPFGLMIFTFIYSLLLFIVSFNIDRIISKIGGVSNSGGINYTSVLVTTSKNNIKDTKDIKKDDKIGILDDEKSYNGYIIPKEILKDHNLKNETSRYDSFISMIQDLKENKINYIFLPDNYSITFSNIDGMNNLQNETKIIAKKSKIVKDEINKKKNNELSKPFSLLLMGVDSDKDGIKGASFNGDSLMLITFNPNTLSTTMISIPRDTYTNITCFPEQRKNKITHAAWYGESCMMASIEKMFDIKIDYFVKINFAGAVSLVNTLGGIEVDVPYNFCEQDSKRRFGNHTVYVREGKQILQGEQALAFARNRHPNPEFCTKFWTNYTSNDFVRGQNQQAVVKAILNKLKDVRSLDTFYNILDAVSNNMETNLSTNEILSLYNIAKKAISSSKLTNASDAVSITRLYLSGYDARIYDYSQKTNKGSKLELYNFVPYKGSINDIKEALKNNLNPKDKKDIKDFSFNVDTPYTEKVIGQGKYSETRINLLANLVGMNEKEASNYLKNNNLTANIKYVTSGGKNGTVIEQSIKPKADIEYIQSVTLTVVKSAITPSATDCSLEENKTNGLCAVPKFDDGKTMITTVKNFVARHPEIKDIIKYKEDTGSCANKVGLVTKQSAHTGYFYDYIKNNKIITITYCE